MLRGVAWTGAWVADVFISYKREERVAVERLAQELSALGLSVWFDASLSAGEAFADEIDREARAAKVILVCWSPAARGSAWVKSEALIGFTSNTLAACYVAGPDGFDPPAPFNAIHAEDLRSWITSPSAAHAGWKSLLRRIGDLCGRADLESFCPHEDWQRSEEWTELAKKHESANELVEEVNRAKSEFLGRMSHELRTPLHAIIGFSEIMAQGLFGPLGDPRYQQYAKDILASGQLLLDLINDILDMAKIEAGKFDLAPRPLDPLDAIEEAMQLVKRRAEEKSLQLLVDAPGMPDIEADHRAVKQMLLNLLSNAVKFTDKGGVMVEGRVSESHIILRVIDTGRGIPREHLTRLAHPFEQVARDYPGTGLGLALTRSLAEMHGGRIAIESQEGKGTVVTIVLPLKFGGASNTTRDRRRPQ